MLVNSLSPYDSNPPKIMGIGNVGMLWLIWKVEKNTEIGWNCLRNLDVKLINIKSGRWS